MHRLASSHELPCGKRLLQLRDQELSSAGAAEALVGERWEPLSRELPSGSSGRRVRGAAGRRVGNAEP